MDVQNLIKKIKKNWGSILFYAVILVFIFSPGAKAWLLQRVISTGLFKAEIKKEQQEMMRFPLLMRLQTPREIPLLLHH